MLLNVEKQKLRSANGDEQIVRVQFGKNEAILDDMKLVINEGDVLIRELPNGISESHYVIDVNYQTGMLPHIYCTTSKKQPVPQFSEDRVGLEVAQISSQISEIQNQLHDLSELLEKISKMEHATPEQIKETIQSMKKSDYSESALQLASIGN
ncbi:unnamed protein product, partial [Laminaria digitata]